MAQRDINNMENRADCLDSKDDAFRRNGICDKEIELLGSFLTTLSEKSLEMEVRRGAGFDRICGSLLTCVTILSAVYLTPAASLFDYYGRGNCEQTFEQVFLAWLYFLALTPLFAALLIIISSLRSQKIKVFGSPDLQKAYVAGIKENLETGKCADVFDEYAMAYSYCGALNEHYVGVRDKNDKTWKRLKVSMVLIMFSISIVLAGGFFLFVGFA